MSLAIGFTNKMYTLWSVSSTPNYEEGRLTGYEVVKTYFQNLSMTESEAISKAKEMGCTDLTPDPQLRGTSVWRGFVLTAEEKRRREADKLAKEEADAELKKTTFTFGKYQGETYEEVSVNDEDYFFWAYSDRSEDKVMRSGMNKTKLMKARKKAEKKRLDAKASLIAQANENGEIVLTIIENPRQYGDYEDTYQFASRTEEGILVFFKEVKECDYNGFEYYMPLIKGKGKRVKNKTLTVVVDPSHTIDGVLCVGLKKA
jgi:hypothetical protein